MNARTSWSARMGTKSGEKAGRGPADSDTSLPLDDLLEARFDEEGRLAQIGSGKQRRVADRLDPRPPSMNAQELERAVQKLAQGLEAIERQGRAPRPPEARAPAPAPKSADPVEPEAPGEPAAKRDFVTFGLDRLEARLEALSKRLQQRVNAPAPAGDDALAANPSAAAAELAGIAAPRAAGDDLKGSEPSLAVRPPADEDESYAQTSIWAAAAAAAQQARREAEEAAAAQRPAELLRDEGTDRQRSHAAPDVERLAEEMAEEDERLRAEQEQLRLAAEAETRRAAEEEAAARLAAEEEARRIAAAEQARILAERQEAQRQAEMAEAQRRAEEMAERRRADEAAEARRLAEARANAGALEAMHRQFAALEKRIEVLQQSTDANQIEPVREDLLELLQQIHAIGRNEQSIAGAVDQVRTRLDGMEAKLNAARNMTGNRLSELQDRLSGLTERLGDMEAEIPGFDAVRENQSAILERFDRMEGLVHRLASPDEMLGRVEAIRGQLQNVASQREVARVEEHILHLADRLDSLPDDLNHRAVLERMEGQLQTLGREFLEARRQRTSGAAEIDARLAELSTGLRDVAETGRTPDLSALEARLSELAARIERDGRSSADAWSRLDERLADLAAAMEKQESEAAGEILAALTHKMDALAEAIEAQDHGSTRRDLESLDQKLEVLARSLAEESGHLSRPQMELLEERLDLMQAQLEEVGRRTQASTAQFGPFAQKLQEISDRISGIGGEVSNNNPIIERLAAIEERLALAGTKGGDNRALHNQLEGIVSRLELLKGRSIDPARLNELFDRVDAAMRMGLADERFGALESRLAGGLGGVAAERFERLEELLGSGVPAGISEERFARLEQKIETLGRGMEFGSDLNLEDLGELRNDIVALRRELRSLPGLGEGEANLGAVLKSIAQRLERLPEKPPATAAEVEAQIERLASLVEDPTHSRGTLAQIEHSLKVIEERLEESRRSGVYAGREFDGAADADLEAVANLARSLSDDVSLLRGANEASDRTTKDALDAVQNTLEAVVKRMAFLERDADKGAGLAERRPELLRPDLPGRPAEPFIEPAAEAVSEDAQVASGTPREGQSAGIFGRFTSSQLLRRATGGRAESFTPDADEADETADLPLEPGTNAPLSSALSGAPSSNTAFMSGGRKNKAAASAPAAAPAEEAVVVPAALTIPAEGEDFLSAARRAAQAAAAEVAEAEREAEQARERFRLSRLLGAGRGRRTAVLAAALVVAIALTAVQMLRNQVAPDESPVAARSGDVPAASPVASLPAAPTSDAPGSAVATAGDESTAAAPQQPPEAAATAPAPAPTPAAEPVGATQSAATGPAEPLTTASVDPRVAPGEQETPAAAARPAERDPAPVTGVTSTEDLPPAIGPEKLQAAAKSGDPVAAFEVAARYAEGRGASQDLAAAALWYRSAAEAGLAPAQYRLGSIYEKGMGIPKDLAAAQDWYRRAAEAGNVKAMHNLAVLYAEGAGGEPDLERAAELFRQAAEHGVRDSQFNLAILHARGLGVAQNMAEAYRWFAIAASSGDAESLKRRDIIAAAMKPADLAKAQAAAEAFQPAPLIAEANDVMMPEGGWGEDAAGGTVPTESDLIALVQIMLSEKGYDPGPADGLLGQQTIQAITQFQESEGLATTGQIDAGLIAALRGQST